MTVRSTHRKRRILPGFLVVLLLVFGQTTATPTLAAVSNSAGISNAGLHAGLHAGLNTGLAAGLGQPVLLPQIPRGIDDALCDIIDDESDNDAQGKAAHAAEQIPFKHFGATNKNIHSQLLAFSSGNAYSLTAIYILTERYRI